MKKVFLFFTLAICLCSTSYPRKKNKELKHVPPTTATLLEIENEIKDQAVLKNIKKIVSNAIKKNKQNKKRSTRKPRAQSKKRNNGPDISKELYEILEQPYYDTALTNKNLSLHLKKVEIKKALRLIGKITDTKFILDAQVKGKVSDFNFDNIALARALKILLDNNNPRLALIKEPGFWRVVKKTTAQEILTPKAHVLREKNTEVRTQTIMHATWNKQLKERVEKLWKGIVGPEAEKQGSYLVFDDYNKKIFFKGHKTKTKEFKTFLQEIDVKIPQIRIDARVVIARKDFEETIGLQWSGIYDQSATQKRTFDFAGVGIGEKKAGAGFKELMNWTLNFLPSTASNSPIKLPFVFGKKDLSTRRLNLVLNAAENKNEIKTILKPSLLVKSDELAQILVGETMPQDTRLQETIEGQPTNISTINYKDIGMKIKVKPTVSPNKKNVFLDILVENSTVKQTTFKRTRVSSNAASSFNYTIETSQSQNRVLLKSGQTTLISGLIVNKNELYKTGLPILQDIPVLGWFFKGRRKVVADKQILIFITPTLV